MNNKTILHIREYFPSELNPSASSWVLGQTQDIQGFGFDPIVISPTPNVPKFLKKLFVHKHNWKQFPDSQIKEYLGVKVIRPGYSKLPNKYFLQHNLFSMEKSITKAAEKLNFSLIHAHFGHAGVAALRLKKKTQKPLITSFYGFDLGSDLRKLSKGYKELARQGDLFLALSQDMKSDLINAGFPKKKIKVHHLGIDVDHFMPKPDYIYSQQNETVILIVATFAERKGIHYAIQGFKKAKKENPELNIKLRIVGDGYYKSSIEALIGVDKDICIINNFSAKNPREMVLKEMQNCDIFVLTSQTMPDGDKEGTPVVLMEAQACAKPCISTWHAGIPEVVIDKSTGLLVEEKNVSEISDTIKLMATDNQLRKKMGEAARKHVKENFNQKTQILRLSEIYENI